MGWLRRLRHLVLFLNGLDRLNGLTMADSALFHFACVGAVSFAR